MQVPCNTDLTSDTYVKQRAWQKASLEQCPLHPNGGCGLARHGTYRRVTIPGLQVPRWYCRKGKTTFSALPDFVAARLGGTLGDVEQAVAASEGTRSLEAVARELRPDIALPGALRWLNRRRKAIAASLHIAVTLAPALSGCAATVGAVRDRLGSTNALIALRALCRAQLPQMSAPIGFAHRRATKFNSRKAFQHKAGTDPPS